MAVSRKPSPTTNATAKQRRSHGTVATPGTGAGADATNGGERQVVLRIPEDILNRVDSVVQRKAIRIPRHTWLLEAVVEKLEREVAQGRNGHGSE